MRAVLQRVNSASVTIENEVVGKINKGFLILLGVGQEDDESDMKYICEKIINLRVFEDENEKMNLSLKDINGELLIVSQFTLYGDCRKGRRPSFDKAGAPDYAKKLYEETCEMFKSYDVKVETGRFAADMQVELVNDGPVTMLLDSKKLF